MTSARERRLNGQGTRSVGKLEEADDGCFLRKAQKAIECSIVKKLPRNIAEFGRVGEAEAEAQPRVAAAHLREACRKGAADGAAEHSFEKLPAEQFRRVRFGRFKAPHASSGVTDAEKKVLQFQIGEGQGEFARSLTPGRVQHACPIASGALWLDLQVEIDVFHRPTPISTVFVLTLHSIARWDRGVNCLFVAVLLFSDKVSR